MVIVEVSNYHTKTNLLRKCNLSGDFKVNLVKEATDYIWSSARFYSGLENREVDEALPIDRYGHFCHN